MLGFLAIFGFAGKYELLLIVGAALLLFSPRIPTAARSIGQGLVEFKRALSPGSREER